MDLLSVFIIFTLSVFFSLISTIITRLIYFHFKRLAFAPPTVLLIFSVLLFFMRSETTIDLDFYLIFSISLLISGLLSLISKLSLDKNTAS